MSLNISHTIIRKAGKAWLCLLLVLPLTVAAQDDEEVYVDTTAIVAPASDNEEGQGVGAFREQANHEVVPPSLRTVPDSTVAKMKRDERFAYANDPAYWSKVQEQKQQASREKNNFWKSVDDFISSDVVRTIFYILMGVAFVLLVYRIIVVNNLYTRRSRSRKEEQDAEPSSEIDDNNLEAKVQSAVAAADYRMAIRYMYLLSLRELNGKGWIKYHAQGTNNEYIQQVHHYGAGNEFRFLTHVYEYVWYGEFNLSAQQFERVYKDFQTFFNIIKP